MKFLLVVLVIAFGLWLWRSGRQPPPAPPAPRTPRGQAPADMVRCAVCGVHLPRIDAEQGDRGVYCSHEHRRQIEG